MFWWKGKNHPNIGDDLAPLILERLFKQDVEHDELARADLISVGSLLGFAIESNLVPTRKTSLHVVGTGLMKPQLTRDVPAQLEFHSVRGYLSRNITCKDDPKVPVGDPGLLIPLITSARMKTPTKKLGVILHHSRSTSEATKSALAHLEPDFIDIRTDDLDTFVDSMYDYEFILSESLHGLIFADALGIPNCWLNLKSLHTGGAFKFYDYFSSVARDPQASVTHIPRSTDEVSLTGREMTAKSAPAM